MNKTHNPSHAGYPDPNSWRATRGGGVVVEILPSGEKRMIGIEGAGGRVQVIENETLAAIKIILDSEFHFA